MQTTALLTAALLGLGVLAAESTTGQGQAQVKVLMSFNSRCH